MATFSEEEIQSNVNKRVNFYDGLFLKQDQFKLEQNYFKNARWLQNYMFRTKGIVNGLEVSVLPSSDPDNYKIKVSAGEAFDEYQLPTGRKVSRELALANEKDITVSKSEHDTDLNDSDRGIYVCITYKEELDHIDASQGSHEIYIKSDVEIEILTYDEYSAKMTSQIILSKLVIEGGVLVAKNEVDEVDKAGSRQAIQSLEKLKIVDNSANRVLAGELTYAKPYLNTSYGYKDSSWLDIKSQIYEIEIPSSIGAPATKEQFGGTDHSGMLVVGKGITAPVFDLNNNMAKNRFVGVFDGDVLINGNLYVTGGSYSDGGGTAGIPNKIKIERFIETYLDMKLRVSSEVSESAAKQPFSWSRLRDKRLEIPAEEILKLIGGDGEPEEGDLVYFDVDKKKYRPIEDGIRDPNEEVFRYTRRIVNNKTEAVLERKSEQGLNNAENSLAEPDRARGGGYRMGTLYFYGKGDNKGKYTATGTDSTSKPVMIVGPKVSVSNTGEVLKDSSEKTGYAISPDMPDYMIGMMKMYMNQ